MAARYTNWSILLTLLVAFACGGETPLGNPDPDPDPDPHQVTIGGTISGHDAAVTLSLNTANETFADAAFTFAQTVTSGSAYAVLFVSSASGQSCAIANGIGIASADVSNVAVTCETAPTELRYGDAEITGQLAVGDLDGDTFLDFVFTIRTLPGHAVGTNLDMFRVVFGNGDGTYSTPVDVNRVGSSDVNERGRSLHALQLDASPESEFVISNGSGVEAFSVGAGRSPTRFYAPGPGGAPLVTADVDGNGAEDLVAIVWGGSRLDYFGLLRNNGDGTFEAEVAVGNRDDPGATALGLGSPVNLLAGDFDGDGNQDVMGVFVVGSGTDAPLALALFSGTGTGSFSYPAALDTISDDVFEGSFAFEETSKEIAAGDFDGDGDLDLAMTSTTDFLLLLENDGAGGFTEWSRVDAGLRPIHVRTADFDGDGALDLLSLNADSGDLVIAFGGGDGSFGTPAGGESAWRTLSLDRDAEPYDVVIADLDGDGLPDIAVAEDGTNPSDSGRGSVAIFLAPGS